MDAAAASALGLPRDVLPAGAQWLDAAGVQALLARHDHVLGF